MTRSPKKGSVPAESCLCSCGCPAHSDSFTRSSNLPSPRKTRSTAQDLHRLMDIPRPPSRFDAAKDLSPSRRVSNKKGPTACDACRKRKIKCNLEEPCSNCFARATPCLYNLVKGNSVAARADLFGSTSTLPPAIVSDSLPPLGTLLARTNARPLLARTNARPLARHTPSSASSSLSSFTSRSPVLQRGMHDSAMLPSRSGSWSSVEAALPYIPTAARPDHMPLLSGRTARRSSNASNGITLPHLPPISIPSRAGSPLAGLRRSASSASLSDFQNWQSRADLPPLESRRMSSFYDQELSSGLTSASSWSSNSEFGSPFSTPGHEDPYNNSYNSAFDGTPSKSISSKHFSTPKAPGTVSRRSAFSSLSSVSSTGRVESSAAYGLEDPSISSKFSMPPLPPNLFSNSSSIYDSPTAYDPQPLYHRSPSPGPGGLARSTMGSISRPRERSLNRYASSSGLSRYEGSGWH